MSPIQAMERSYSAVKQMLREGVFAPGARIEANRLAEELGVSMTPVRDVLHRLVGERLVEAASGDGFRVPQFTEAALRDLYAWNSALLLMAIRTNRGHSSGERPSEAATEAEGAALLFERLAAGAPNRELRIAVAGVSDRLHPFRRIENEVLDPIVGELDELGVRDARQIQAIRRYHLRRMRAVPAILRRRAREEL